MAQPFYLVINTTMPSPITGKITQLVMSIDSTTQFDLTDDANQSHSVFTFKNDGAQMAALVIPLDIPVKAGTLLTGLNGSATLTISP